MEEKWKVIEDYPDYAISSHGRIKRITAARGTSTGHILKPAKNSAGYPYTCLRNNGKPKGTFVHTLVLTAFDKPRPEGMTCNHKDGVKTNNHIDNLEWVTHKENMEHASKMKLLPCRKGSKNNRAKLSEHEVYMIKKILASKRRPTISRIAKLFNVCRSTIGRISNGLAWRSVQI